MNVTIGFRCVFALAEGQLPRLAITARTGYRLWHNGRFVGCGPARSPHGHLRVDNYDLTPQAGVNVVAIEANAANVPGYAMTDEHPLVQGELVVNGSVVAATGVDDLPQRWQALVPGERIQKVQRMSRQRGFAEAWRLTPSSSDWRFRADARVDGVAVEPVGQPGLLPRVVPHPAYACVSAGPTVSAGVLEIRPEPQLHKWEQWMRAESGKTFAGYPASQWDVDMSGELSRRAPRVVAGHGHGADVMAAGTWRMHDFGVNQTGFLRATVTCREAAVVWLVGDELATDGACDCRRLEYMAGARYELQPGTYDLEMAEVVTVRYAAVLVLSGALTVTDVSLREYVRATRAEFSCPDAGLEEVFRAGVRTFAHNAMDIYLDCPSRERAGWLCDSFFTGRVEPWLTGGSLAETVFLDNYAKCPPLPYLPAGMLPKCYPSDGPQMRGGASTSIPNWALWFVIEVAEYAERGGDAAVVAACRQRCADLFGYFERFLNADGLLEKLESWIFVDWSSANDHVQDVSYPTNMLYAAALDAAGRLYDQPAWCDQAAALRRTVLEQSWDGSAFVDNARRDAEGRLRPTGVHTEACQYYAFYFGVATPQSHPPLWQELLTTTSAAPDAGNARLPRAGIFPSLHLRLLLLARYGEHRRLVDELRAAFLPMARLTGTLWEHAHTRNSCDHGFCSHVVHLLLAHVLGLKVDWQKRTIRLVPPDFDLPWCRARLPIGGMAVEIGWRRENGKVIPEISGLPAGWNAGS
jgi:alpha-L-rhamnosidase